MSTGMHEKKRKRSMVADAGDDHPITSSGTSRSSKVHRKNSSISNLLNGMDIDSSQDLSKDVRQRTSPVVKKRSKGDKMKQGSDLRRASLMSVTSVDETQPEEGESQPSHGRQKRRRKASPPAAIIFKPVVRSPPAVEVPKQIAESSKTTRKGVLFPAVVQEPELTPLQKSMKDKLQGSAFRYVQIRGLELGSLESNRKYNELIYKSDSKTFLKLVKENPQMYEEVRRKPQA